MHGAVDHATTYMVAVLSIMLAFLTTNSNLLLAVGGLVLLGLRIYVEVRNIIKAHKEDYYG